MSAAIAGARVRAVLGGLALLASATCAPAPDPPPPDDDPTNDLGGVSSSGAFFTDNLIEKLKTGFFHRKFIVNTENVEVLALSTDKACARMTANANDVRRAYANNPAGEAQITALAAADNEWFPVATTTLRITFPDPHTATGDLVLASANDLEVCTKVEAAELRFDQFGGPYLYTNVVCYSPNAGSAVLADLSESHIKLDATSVMRDPTLVDVGELTVSVDTLRCSEYEDALSAE